MAIRPNVVKVSSKEIWNPPILSPRGRGYDAGMILVLEDSTLRLRVLRRFMKGVKVVAYDRVQPFLAFAGTLLERPDLIILDCHVTEGTGLDAANHLPSRLRNVPVLVWSDDPDCADRMTKTLLDRGWTAQVTWSPFGSTTASVVRSMI